LMSAYSRSSFEYPTGPISPSAVLLDELEVEVGDAGGKRRTQSGVEGSEAGRMAGGPVRRGRCAAPRERCQAAGVGGAVGALEGVRRSGADEGELPVEDEGAGRGNWACEGSGIETVRTEPRKGSSSVVPGVGSGLWVDRDPTAGVSRWV